MNKFEKERCAFLTRISYIYAGKPSDDLLNFCLRGFRFELSPQAKTVRDYKKMIGEESKRIGKI